MGLTLRTIRHIPPSGMITHGVNSRSEPRFSDLVARYDVLIMKHCFPASDVLQDIREADPTSPRQSLENYKAIYRLLRNMFDKHPDKLFIIWTLSPRHRLYEPTEGHKDENAARATEFSNWLKGDLINEGGSHPNIFIWDFRGLMIDPDTDFLNYGYESDHNSPDSHPNKLANNKAGPEFAKFIVDSIMSVYGSSQIKRKVKIVFLHHSTGLNVYKHPSQGVPAWFTRFNASSNMSYLISHKWYPQDGNMPVHYYRSWLDGR